MHRVSVSLAVAMAAVVSVGCRTPEGVRDLPLDLGTRAAYWASKAEVESAATDAIDEVGAGRLQQPDVEGGATVLLAVRAAGLFENGSVTRVVVENVNGTAATDIRVLSRPASRLDLSGHAERFPAQTLREMDRRLGPRAIAPVDGLRVRGVWRDTQDFSGRLEQGAEGRWMVSAEPGVQAAPLSEIADPEVFRGSWGHSREWSLGLMLLGGVAGYQLSGGDLYPILGGYFGGAVVGLIVGRAHRTEAWSPMELSVPGSR